MTFHHPLPSRAVRGAINTTLTRPFPQRVATLGTVLLSAALLSACGGGGGDQPASMVNADASTSLAKATALQPVKTSSDIATPIPGTTPPSSTAPETITAGATITDVEIQNEGAAQTNVPFTFGQVVAVGQLSKNAGVAARLSNGKLVPLQIDVKASHADGSVRHMIVSGVLPSLAAGQVETIQLVQATAPAATSVTLEQLAASGLTSSVVVTQDGVPYSASLAQALTAPNPVKWLSGDVANEWIVSVPLKKADGTAHPLLTASFAVRWYAGLTKQARVDVVVENAKTFKAGARNLTYDVNVDVAGRSIYSKTGLTHYHHARWHQSAWWDAATTPTTHVRTNTAYLIASKAISNYDQTVKPSESVLATFANQVLPTNTGPMTIGPVVAYMGTAGGRGDIGPLPIFTVSYLLSKDKRARAAMIAAADGAATWSIHMRDENTGYPVRVDNEANKELTTHGNLYTKGPLPVPRCDASAPNLCKTPYSDDTAHQPSLAYLPYLLTGDYYYLEELHFWAASNPLATDPGNSGRGLGLVRWQQVRGQAWSLRTLGHAAYITPDAHPMKDYFTKQLDNNLSFYNDTYVTGNPNQLGVYDGSGQSAFQINNSAPWQDDFLTWSFGYLAELGFEKAEPILRWKAKYPVGRMTAPGFCWIKATSYTLAIRPAEKAPLFTSLEQVYLANFSGDSISNEGKTVSHPQGLRFIDQPCASQAQADWFTATVNFGWRLGRMDGYADSPLGYPANMQPALAVSATSGIPNAQQAWTIFDGRASKQKYENGPQWAIIPR